MQRHPVRYLLARYEVAFMAQQSMRGKIPPDRHPKFGGKEAKLAKMDLDQYGMDRLLTLMGQFFEQRDAWTDRAGFTYAIFHSQLGRLISAPGNSLLYSAQTERNMLAGQHAQRLIDKFGEDHGGQ